MRRIVLLPGLDGTGALFKDFVRAAPPGVRVDVVAFPPEALEYAELIERVGPALKVTPDTILVAESFSGPLAMMIAARCRVAALVLCNSFVVAPRAPMLRGLVTPLLFRVRPPAALVRHFLVGAGAPNLLVSEVGAAIASVPPTVVASRVRSVLSVDVRTELALCSMPIVYLRGTQDRVVTDASVDAIERSASVPVSVVRIAGPHLLLQAAPDAAWRAIRAVLE